MEQFALCKNCYNIIHFELSNCQKCNNYLDKKNYKQYTTMKNYKILIQALMAFDVDIIEDCYSMISIEIEKDISITPELFQIYKKNNEYTYVHLQKDTHKILKDKIINPKIFTPILNPNKKYIILLLYGPNVIHVYQ